VWIKEAQHLRGLAILGVIAIHTLAYYTSINQVNGLVVTAATLDIFAHFAVPLFVIASGIVLSAKYSSSFSKVAFYRKRLVSIIPPYLIFSTLYIVLGAWRHNDSPSLGVVLYDYFSGHSFYHLWFIILIIQLYLLFPYLIHAYERYFYKMKLRILLIAIALQISYQVALFGPTPIVNNSLVAAFSDRFFLGYIAYFIVGIYVGRNLDFVRKFVRSMPILPIATTVLTITGVISITTIIWEGGVQQFEIFSSLLLYLVFFLTPLLYFCVFLIFFRWANSTQSKFTRTFGKYSLWIYLIHPLFIIIIVESIGVLGLTYESWIFYPIVFVVTCILLLMSVVVLDRIPFNKIIGGPSKERPFQQEYGKSR